MNEYIWRGLKLGDVAVQPTLGVGYKGLSLTAWGSYGLSNNDDVKEFDLTLAYSISGFNIGVTDYWFSEGLDPDSRYFKYDAHGTNHLFEANIGYDFGPLALQWYTNFAGNDGLNKNGKRAYSSYFEVNVPFKLSTIDWTATAGAVPYASTPIWHHGLRCHQPVAARDQGYPGDRLVRHPHLRTADRQPLFTESLPGSRFYAATLIFTRSSPSSAADGRRGGFF